jgi:hypothetical protein
MSEAIYTPRSSSDPPRRGRFVALQALVWYSIALLLGTGAGRAAAWVENARAPLNGRAAAWVEHVRAPLLVYPAVVGGAIGLALVAVMRLANIGHRPTLVSGAALAALAAVAGQHYFPYRDYLQERAAFLAQKRDSGLPEMLLSTLPEAAPSFAGYMRGQADRGRPIAAGLSLRGPAAWASWALDGTLLLAATAAVVLVFSRAPYCDSCGSWYRPVRSGRVAGDAAERLAEAAAQSSQPIVAASYRLSHCASGCGPARLELTSDDAQGHSRCGDMWLAAADRQRVVMALDEQGTRNLE